MVILQTYLPAFLAYAWLVSKAAWYWNHREDLSFGWVVLVLSGYVLFEQWEKRSRMDAIPVAAWSRYLGGILFLCGLLLLFQFQVYTASMGMKPAALMGLVAACYAIIFANLFWASGWSGVRHYAFGFLFLLIALPMPSLIQGLVINGLQKLVATIVVEVLTLVGIPAQQVGSLIHLPTGTVGVDEACSGIRSLQSTLMGTLFIGYLSFRHWSLQISLLVAGVTLAFIGNLFRAFFLSYVANQYGLEAIDKYHDGAGYSIMAFSIAGVALIAWLILKFERLAVAHSRESWLVDLIHSICDRRDTPSPIDEFDLDWPIQSESLALDPTEQAEIFNEIRKKWGITFFDNNDSPTTWRQVAEKIVRVK